MKNGIKTRRYAGEQGMYYIFIDIEPDTRLPNTCTVPIQSKFSNSF